ncbi:helix-turn-helix transcriptional regulator [Belliella sp. DSM 111904]|uniref:Helix-turn-helix transcriptional regulator n=1 Tax=Belliella filtrata TaxID=2923435 RepID=A0ABS9V0I5_9BACT|nr:helix-turn-helix transcriptional regulator [Belliella filtrata]MCH7409921.1 helix-turn-helix transcriptional regulator [Belliella filtrata]
MVNAQKIMRILRESKDFSQEYVANVLDINQKTYSNLESGKTKLTLERIKQLAEFYHIKPEYFLSNQLPIINYNNSKINSQDSELFPNLLDTQKAKLFYEKIIFEKEKIIKEKDKQIIILMDVIEILKSEFKFHG